jgi:hypothetical protein
VRVDRAVEHNRGAVVEQRQRFLNREVSAFQVDVHLSVEVRLGHGLERSKDADAGVDKKDIYLAEALLCFSKEVVNLRQLRHCFLFNLFRFS